MELVKRFTMSDSEWAVYIIYKELPTTLRDKYCDRCSAHRQLYIYNQDAYCHTCISHAITNRLSFELHNGGVSGAIDFNKRNFGTKKCSNGSFPGKN